MGSRGIGSLRSIVAAGVMLSAFGAAAAPIPVLKETHGATQLFVDGSPYLILGGEFHNSSASSLKYMAPLWARLTQMHLNTVIAPAYWELIEPKEGVFDFASIDGLVSQAREHKMHIVLLWFGSWKNSMSSYVPGWVKADSKRFPRSETSDGGAIDILSPLGQNSMNADATAFAALMKHLREYDGNRHTVIMVQVENEVGMIPEARDHSPAADAAFDGPVPGQLTTYLSAHKDNLDPKLRTAWAAHGYKTGADWEDTFGKSIWTDELFDAWTQARYTGAVAARGEAAYPLPLYVNAALSRPGYLPGRYVSGGPLPHLFDIWHAAAPAISIMAPDIYFANFKDWTDKYSRPGNPLFIPETGRNSAQNLAANAFYAFGQKGLIGFSPFAIASMKPDQAAILGKAYDVLNQLKPLILAHQGMGTMLGLLPHTTYDGNVDKAPQTLALGDYLVTATFPEPTRRGQNCPDSGDCGWPADSAALAHGGLIIQLAPDEFVVAGVGVSVTFDMPGDGKTRVGLERVEEGQFVNGIWSPGRVLNGDETGQGREIDLASDHFEIQRVRLFRYR